MLRKRLYFALECFVALMTPAAWGEMMFYTAERERLALSGLANLRYFTVLSNLFAGLASLLCLIVYLRRRKTVLHMPLWLVRLRSVAVSAVMVTFLTVALFLGPVYGFETMYVRANFWFHLILPLASLAGWFLIPAPTLPFRATLLSMIPVAVYAVFYCGNILLHGVGLYPDTNDWYGFLTWGIGPGLGIFAGLLLISWGVSALIWVATRKKVTNS